jgi:hypothetical protein
VFLCHLPSGRQGTIQLLRKAQECTTLGSHPTAAFYAGNAFTSPRSRRAVPGFYLGTRLGQAVQDISHC